MYVVVPIEPSYIYKPHETLYTKICVKIQAVWNNLEACSNPALKI